MRVMSCTRPCQGLDWSHSLFYLTLLLWTRRMNGLADFSNYLSRIITSHSAQACDGQPLRLHCPRHSTISVQSAFYGSGGARLCGADPPLGARNHSCSAFTALQVHFMCGDMQHFPPSSLAHLCIEAAVGVSEPQRLPAACQPPAVWEGPLSWHCQIPPCGLQVQTKRVQQQYTKISPLSPPNPNPSPSHCHRPLHPNCFVSPRSAEHKRHVVCEGETMTLRCKPPKVLNIYAAVYGRSLGQTDTCPSHLTGPPPFECLNHEAVHLVSKSCYSKQKCVVAVSNQTFRDPCFPGTRKYLSVVYSCVPQTLLREADPYIFSSTSSPTVDTEKAPPADLEGPFSKGSRRPDHSGAMMSNSLLTYAYIKEHPEMAALLFTSSVCVGLLLTLLAVSVRVTCRVRPRRDHRQKSRSQTVPCQEENDDEDDDNEEEDDDDDEEGTESSLISAAGRQAIYGWEEVTYVSEAAERAERIERREMIIQEIWMNAYLNGSSC